MNYLNRLFLDKSTNYIVFAYILFFNLPAVVAADCPLEPQKTKVVLEGLVQGYEVNSPNIYSVIIEDLYVNENDKEPACRLLTLLPRNNLTTGTDPREIEPSTLIVTSTKQEPIVCQECKDPSEEGCISVHRIFSAKEDPTKNKGNISEATIIYHARHGSRHPQRHVLTTEFKYVYGWVYFLRGRAHRIEQ